MVLLISELAKIGATKPIVSDYGSPMGGRGVCACVGMVCYHCIVHLLNSRENSIFFVSTAICAEQCCQILEDIFLCFVPN